MPLFLHTFRCFFPFFILIFVTAFGGKGYFCTTPEEFSAAMKDAIASGKTCLVNCLISPTGSRKPQEHGWLTRKDAVARL